MKHSRFYRSHDNGIFGPQVTLHSWCEGPVHNWHKLIEKAVQQQPCKGKSKVNLRNDFYQTAWPQWLVGPDPKNVSDFSYHDLERNYDFQCGLQKHEMT